MKGEYFHSIDTKGRLIIPLKLRQELSDTFVVTKGLDNCLYVYPLENWEKLEEQINKLSHSKSRGLKRFFLSSAIDCSLDTQGRILISSNLREFAGLKKDVVIIGVLERAEIWDKEKWDEYCDNISLEQIEEAMEDMGF